MVRVSEIAIPVASVWKVPEYLVEWKNRIIELYIFKSIFIDGSTTAHPHALILIHSPTELLHLQTWEQYDGSGGVAETGTE